MLLVIDNYDSFTYNLVQYLGELGAEMKVFRNDEISVDEIGDGLVPKQILISPGPGIPENAGISMSVVERFAGEIPILGVCLGHQAIGKVFGGNVVRAPEPVHGKPSTVKHDDKGVFKGIPQGFEAGRYHSLVVDRLTFPVDLEVSAETEEGIIMGLRHREFPVEGVQFHPESILTPEGKRILNNFLEQTTPSPA
ncbi:MAG: aminodeoxychorismate/anthranilate synthase component II [Acidobacteria bacterium]|nr:MAG: aminodeoxychorismate/anthranilate synthase component II [Acidobacteriota bacterium]REK03920.1 MAG: aminodeoxychorismate/anthranilate synthase component II [Acidobacteriota bacterium]REK15082.1 MAG: aminodeoxychorismate/anthranilate synthase component II [Acidobacteriota bacterium]REK46172.1 MAG: aminodeoxychorismate/anthranilate synthase component II [Acidobacteriota bacterium]